MGPWSSPASRTSRFRRSPGCRVKSGSPTSASVYGLCPASAVGPAGSTPHAASAMEIAAAVARRNMDGTRGTRLPGIVNESPSPNHRSDAGPLRAVVAGWYRGGMSLRGQALQEFDLPAAPQRIDELPSSAPETDALRVHAPAGRFLLLCGAPALAVAFEATLFDLLAESRYPAPRPRRARSGAFIARVEGQGKRAGAACYRVGSGEPLDPYRATTPQFLEMGRLLARLHQLGEAHPASVPAPLSCIELAGRLPASAQAEVLAPRLRTDFCSLPAGAPPGRPGPPPRPS